MARNEFKKMHYLVKTQVWGTLEETIQEDVLINEDTEREDKTEAVRLFLGFVQGMLAEGCTVERPSIQRPGFILRGKYGDRISIWLEVEEDDNYPTY